MSKILESFSFYAHYKSCKLQKAEKFKERSFKKLASTNVYSRDLDLYYWSEPVKIMSASSDYVHCLRTKNNLQYVVELVSHSKGSVEPRMAWGRHGSTESYEYSFILVVIILRHIGQSSRSTPHSQQVWCPQPKAMSFELLRHMGQILLS